MIDEQHPLREFARGVMLDIECMGVTNTWAAPVVSIGAVYFDGIQQRLGRCTYRVVSLSSELDAGAMPDADTILWWLGQSPEVRQAATSGRAQNGKTVAIEFNRYLSDLAVQEYGDPLIDSEFPVSLWGNGANFDQPVLRGMFHRHKVEPLWSFRHERCYRTFKALAPHTHRVYELGQTQHHALHDAIAQAKHVLNIWKEVLLK